MSDDLNNVINQVQPPAEPVAEAPQPAPEPEAEKQTVPLAVLLETKRDLQARADYWKGVAEGQSRKEPEPQRTPDFLAEPDKITGHIESVVRQAVVEISYNSAVDKHGEAAIAAAYEALKASDDGAAKAKVLASRDPYRDLVKWHEKHQAMARIGDDPAAFAKRLEEEIRAKVLAELTVKDAKGPVRAADGKFAPPPSGAVDPNLGPQASADFEFNLDAVIGRGG